MYELDTTIWMGSTHPNIDFFGNDSIGFDIEKFRSSIRHCTTLRCHVLNISVLTYESKILKNNNDESMIHTQASHLHGSGLVRITDSDASISH